MNLVIDKASTFTFEIPVIVSIFKESRGSGIEEIGVSTPNFVPVMVSIELGGNRRTIFQVKVLVKNFNAIVNVETKGQEAVNSIFIPIGDIFFLVSQNVIPVSKAE